MSLTETFIQRQPALVISPLPIEKSSVIEDRGFGACARWEEESW